jgi:putative flippase GtrA
VPRNLLIRMIRPFPTYSLVSLMCLFLDSLIYASLVTLRVPISVSAALGYLFGLGFSYLALTKIGINKERNQPLKKRTIFAMTGFIGLSVTYISALITTTYVTEDPFVVKIISVVLSFITVYILRAKYVFY